MAVVTVREAECIEADLQKIWPVCRQAFPKYETLTQEQFVRYCTRLWLESPARTSEHPFGWVAERQDGTVVGFLGLIPVRIKVGDGEASGGAGHSWAVLPAYRYSSLKLLRKMLEWGQRRLTVITGANEGTADILGRSQSGFKKIPIESFNRHYWWVMRPDVVIKWALKGRGHHRTHQIVGWPLIRNMFSAVAGGYFAGHRSLRFDGSSLPVNLLHECGEEFDELWHRLRMAYRVIGVRDRATLNWRHFRIPSVIGRTVIFACRESGRLAGYLALQERNGTAGDPPGLFAVTDMFYDRQRADVLQSLFNAAFDYAESRNGAIFQVSHMSKELADRLSPQRPYVRPLQGWGYWYRAPLEAIAKICESQEWWPSASDGESNI